MYYVLDEQRRPIRVNDILEWAKLFEDMDRTVAKTDTPNGNVSTVFLGLDHGVHSPPLLYETMVFGGPWDKWQLRYATEEEAIKGHKACVLALPYAAEPKRNLIDD